MSLNTSLPILKAKVIFIKYLVSGTGTLLVIGIGIFLGLSFIQAKLYQTDVKTFCEIVFAPIADHCGRWVYFRFGWLPYFLAIQVKKLYNKIFMST